MLEEREEGNGRGRLRVGGVGVDDAYDDGVDELGYFYEDEDGLGGTQQQRQQRQHGQGRRQERRGRNYNNSEFEFAKDEPWKTLLGVPSRAAWRVSATRPPANLARALRRRILDRAPTSYSNKVLQVAHRNSVMAPHRALALKRERERRRLVVGGGGGGDGGGPPPSASKKDAAAQPVLYGPEETLASFKFRLYPNYAVVKRILQEARGLLATGDNNNSWIPKRVVDFGIGCGSASAAAVDVFGTNTTLHDCGGGDGIEWIHGIDASRTMREGAKSFLDEYVAAVGSSEEGDDDESASRQQHNQTRITLAAHLSSSSGYEQSVDSTAGASVVTTEESGTFDLALMAYTATELPDLSSTLAAVAILWEKLRPGGVLVLVEPGTPDGFSTVRTVRNMLLQSCPPSEGDDRDGAVEEECHVIAPCTHNGKCPIERFSRVPKRHRGEDRQQRNQTSTTDDVEDEENMSDDDEEVDDDSDVGDSSADDGAPRRRYCSFVQSMPGSGSGQSKGEKFSYLVAQKRVPGYGRSRPSDLSERELFAGSHLINLLKQTLSVSEVENDLKSADELTESAMQLESRYLDAYSNDGDDNNGLGLHYLRGDANRKLFGRILHAPKKKKAHVLIDCCCAPGADDDSEEGRIVRHKVTKSMARTAPGLYAAARKSRWGGYWPNIGTK